MTTQLSPTNGARPIEPELLLQLLRSGRAPVVLDVRHADECVRTGRVEGSRRISLRHLVARRAELAGLEPVLVVTVSNHGASARAAASALLAQGFEDVRYLDGGIERWLDLGYPVEP